MPTKKQKSERKVKPSKRVVGRSLDPVVRPEIGGCDFCSSDNVPVIALGKMGRRIAGFCACERCCISCGEPCPNAPLERSARSDDTLRGVVVP